MPKEKQDKEFGRRVIWCVVPYLVVGAACVIAMIIPPLPPPYHFRFVMAAIVFVLCVVLCPASYSIVSRDFYCPDCGDVISAPLKTRSTLKYYCEKCDVIWNTGVKHSSGGSGSSFGGCGG